MKLYIDRLVPFFAGVILIILLAGQLAFKNEEKQALPSHQWQAPPMPENLSFAGEAVPLDRWDVRERMDRELMYNYYGQANILFLLKLSNRYFPAISERLKANGVPDDFKYLCVAESNLLATALSRSGAVSFWQFLDATAPEYRLTVNSEVDERYHLERATDAACLYFKKAYQKFGSWTAAAASYNCGMGGYNGQATAQQTSNYYDLQLPEETNRYIFRILAFKQLLSNAEAYGYKLEDKEKYAAVPYRSLIVDSSIGNLVQFALSQGTSYKMLRQMNPWLRGRTLTVAKGKTFEVRLPEK
ncbi:lytic transglycosylase domain-containing protein [Paraflavisolibacter sp. H34]|uniref:lytic transglycosylase domain-containing protein n=1 Tax=Huijunlia imazamoxiresistens TaxID=3127457 RepID=UPI003016FCE9